jgi:CDP-diacylglycerol--serine O-phosphatidyltransferase
MGRAIIVVPSFFTLANLFFGIWSIVLAARGDFYRASWWIVIAGVFDMLDGLSARVSKTGSRFGAQLDSLVDLVSFGVAPALLLYFTHFADQGAFAWVFLYGFVVCGALRLARFNVHDDSAPKVHFTGLPSPAAGMALATFYPFTQTSFYQSQLVVWPWNSLLIFLVIALSLAMVSNVQYARLPRIGLRSIRGLLGLGVNLTILAFAIWERDIFFFPLGITYASYGIVRAIILSIVERGENGEDAVSDAHHIPSVVRARERRRGAKRRPAKRRGEDGEQPPGAGGA